MAHALFPEFSLLMPSRNHRSHPFSHPIRIEIEAEGEVMKVVLRSICRLQEVFGMAMELGHIKDDDDNVRPPSCASMEAKVASHLAALVSHTIAACRTAKRLPPPTRFHPGNAAAALA
uniref:Uncharacterized protein n=3 Tax=Oryza TaxID=4527 RepID=Q8W5M9_ORYSJ|nr:hypothetical protein [Oryza sativa Japonica Group]ABB47784.1 hypothetical protein LOC_Os10g33390 [Oryza sativa Japonica Group]